VSDLNNGGELRLIVKEMADLNARFDALAKPPVFRVADVVSLAGALIALALFMMSAFALSERIQQAEQRLAHAQERVADDVRATREDVADLKARAAVLEDRGGRSGSEPR
jgi:hypothetical protein